MGSYTANLNLYKPDNGETNWDSEVNNNFDTLDDAKLNNYKEFQNPSTIDVTYNLSLTTSDEFIAITSNIPDDTEVNVNLPTVSSGNTGQMIYVKLYQDFGDGGVVNIVPSGSSAIDGVTGNLSAYNEGDKISLISDGSSGWWTFEKDGFA